MKFEEVLPKMRDEGRIAIHNGNQYKFFDGNIYLKMDHVWILVTLTTIALISDEWSLEPIKVKKWRWVFGCGETVQREVSSYMTEEEALSYKFHANSYAWMERIDHTLKEEEE